MDLLLTGAVALELRVLPHHVARLARKSAFPTVQVGRYRAVRRTDLPLVRQALVTAGFLKPAVEHK